MPRRTRCWSREAALPAGGGEGPGITAAASVAACSSSAASHMSSSSAEPAPAERSLAAGSVAGVCAGPGAACDQGGVHGMSWWRLRV